MKNYIGLRESISKIIEHFFAAAFPLHFGQYNRFIDEDSKREVETTKAMEALADAAAYFIDDEKAIKALVDEVKKRLPAIFSFRTVLSFRSGVILRGGFIFHTIKPRWSISSYAAVAKRFFHQILHQQNFVAGGSDLCHKDHVVAR